MTHFDGEAMEEGCQFDGLISVPLFGVVRGHEEWHLLSRCPGRPAGMHGTRGGR
jgi:hypothetical protein